MVFCDKAVIIALKVCCTLTVYEAVLLFRIIYTWVSLKSAELILLLFVKTSFSG